MTSSGHVTMPEAMPAEAPQKALTLELGREAHLIATLEKVEPRFLFCIGASLEERLVVIGAYRSLAVVGDGGGSGSEVIVDAVQYRAIRSRQ